MSGNNITLKLGDTTDSGAPVIYSLGLIYQPGLLACITQLDLSRFPINGRYLGNFVSPGVFRPQRLVLLSIRCLPTVAVTWLTEMRGVVKSGFTFGGGL